MIFLNPNKDKSVKSTDMLNAISKTFRQDSFYRFVSQEGFELCPFDFQWEWIINFNNKSGFIVLREYGAHIRMFVYTHSDDLDPKEFLIRDYKPTHNGKLISLIKSEYRSKIQ